MNQCSLADFPKILFITDGETGIKTVTFTSTLLMRYSYGSGLVGKEKFEPLI